MNDKSEDVDVRTTRRIKEGSVSESYTARYVSLTGLGSGAFARPHFLQCLSNFCLVLCLSSDVWRTRFGSGDC